MNYRPSVSNSFFSIPGNGSGIKKKDHVKQTLAALRAVEEICMNRTLPFEVSVSETALEVLEPTKTSKFYFRKKLDIEESYSLYITRLPHNGEGHHREVTTLLNGIMTTVVVIEKYGH